MSRSRLEGLAQQFGSSSVTPKPASEHTARANAEFACRLPLDDPVDFEEATRGLIAAEESLVIKNGLQPSVHAWNMDSYNFIRDRGAEAPSTVNPSLWRQARLNNIHGFFEVVPGMYQIRGYDISNMTFIEGEKGVIVIDPAVTVESAAAMMEMYRKHRGGRPVTAVIITHSHVDHFGGILAVLPKPDADGRYPIPIIAPSGFMEHAVSENVLAGNAMVRRALYMYGSMLPTGELGQVDCGLGKTTSRGLTTLVEPNVVIDADNGQGEETRVIDGVEIVFYLCPESEAPSEFIMYYPKFRVLNMSEVACKNCHNLYTLRGAQIRDGSLWASYINHCLVRFAPISDVVIAQHHWPTFGRDRIKDYLEKQRDVYKFTHDQTLRLANQGHTPLEIADKLRLPKGLSTEFSIRDYYGTLSHNSRAVYQKYLGFFDGNPANLNPLPPVENAKKAVEYMGGATAVLAKAKADFEKGEYRWVASVTNQVVFADPSNREARLLCADAMEQLGYIAESGPWRNFYLMGAFELRNPVVREGQKAMPRTAAPHVLSAMGLNLVLDFCAVRLNFERCEDAHVVFDLQCTDSDGKRYIVGIQHGILTYTDEIPMGATELYPYKAPDCTLRGKESVLRDLIQGAQGTPEGVKALVSQGQLQVQGDVGKLMEFRSWLEMFELMFPIVEP